MSITSTLFLFVFLPITLAAYYLLRNKCGEYILVAASLVFYAFGSVKYLLVFVIAAALTIVLGRILGHLDDSKKSKGYDTVIVSYAQFMIGAHDNPSSSNYRMFAFDGN